MAVGAISVGVKIAVADTAEDAHTVDSGGGGLAFTLIVINNSVSASATIKASISVDSATHDATHLIFPDDTVLIAKEQMEWTGRVAAASKNIVVEASTTDVIFTVEGYQDA